MTSRRDFLAASGAAFIACLTRFAPAAMVEPDWFRMGLDPPGEDEESSESSWSCPCHGDRDEHMGIRPKLTPEQREEIIRQIRASWHGPPKRNI